MKRGMRQSTLHLQKQRNLPKKDVSNTTVLIMLLLVIVVSVVSMLIYLNVLTTIQKPVVPTSVPSDTAQGVVSLTISPPPSLEPSSVSAGQSGYASSGNDQGGGTQ